MIFPIIQHFMFRTHTLSRCLSLFIAMIVCLSALTSFMMKESLGYQFLLNKSFIEDYFIKDISIIAVNSKYRENIKTKQA